MDSGLPPNKNLYFTIEEIKANLEALLRRPTPATQAELVQFGELLKTTLARQQAETAQLAKTVQTLLQPVTQFDEAALAKRLVTAISPQLPTPAGLTQAGEQAGQAIRQAVQTSINQATNSIQTISRQVTADVQASVRQLTGAAGDVRQAVAAAPTHVRIDFLRTKRDVAIVAVVGGAFMLLTAIFIYTWSGGFDKVPLADYLALQERFQFRDNQLSIVHSQRQQLLRDYPALAYRYFPFKDDPAPVAKPKPTPAPPKPAKKRRR